MQEADRVVVMIPKSKVKYQKLLNSLEEMGLEFYGESEGGDSYCISKKDLKRISGE